MVEIKRFIFFFLILTKSVAIVKAQHRPFPQHVRYFAGAIRPNHISQAKLDNTVKAFYNQWKARFVKHEKDGVFVWFENKNNKQCVSEGQGYGMIITAQMAGYDPDARNIYDGMLRYVSAHPSGKSKYLMAWAQFPGGKSTDNTSASVGDIDIAYSLLLADKQWGSSGPINYLKEAKLRINAIMQHEVNHQTWTVLLSDAIESESKDYFSTRSSDFMPSHFKAFRTATSDERWDKVVNEGYKLFIGLEDQYSPEAGLIPDFIVNINKKAKPAPPKFLESVYDGQYNYNACRVPWRIGVDYLLTGDARSKKITDRINSWIRKTTNNDTYNLSAGYTLAGNDIKHRYFEALSFIAPFAVSSMVDQKNQAWLNKVWDYLVGFKMKDFDYYDNSIKLLNMIIISGNYVDAQGK